MGAPEFDARQYNHVERSFGAGCKDARITAAHIDIAGNVPAYCATDVFPWTALYGVVSPWQLTDIKEQHEYNVLVPQQPFAPIDRERWGTDYPGDLHIDRPQGLSFLAAAIVAARRAAGIADGSSDPGYGGE